MTLQEQFPEIPAKIKIGRKEYEIQPGDYILYNRACYQLVAGDGRTLKWEGWHRYTSLVIPKTTLKKIPLDKMIRKELGNEVERTLLIRYYFKPK